MRFLFFPNLDHINNQIHGRSTGERRYTCKFSVFSLKSTKEQRAQRQELIKIINARVQHMKSMGISTSSGIDDLTKPHIRKLYTILISILNTSYGDYNFANTAFENFIPTTPQQCLDQIYNDILLPLDHYDNRSKFSFHRAPLNSTEGGAQSAKYQLLMSLREAIGFDLVANINNQKNTDGVIPSINRAGQPVEKELSDDSEEEQEESPTPAQNGDSQQPPTPSSLTPQPMRTPQASGNPNKQLYIFEYDNDGDNPLFSESRLWTHVYLIYNPILKRAMLITVGCKSTQGLYSPAIVPQMAHKGRGYDLDDLDDFSLGAGATQNFSSYKKNNPNNSFSAVSGVDTSGLDGTVTFSDDEGSTDDEEYEFDDSNANMKLSVVQRLLQLEEEDDDDDEEEEEEEEMRDQPSGSHYGANNNNNQSTYSFNAQHRIMNTHQQLPQDDFLIPNHVNSPQNHEITPDDLPIPTNNNNNNNNNPALSSHSKSRHSHNNNQQSLYSYEPTNQYSSMSRHSGRRDENGMMENQSFVSSTISYTNHVELVERNGELEIIPVLMDPRQLAQMKRQEEEKKQQQQTALKQQEVVGHQSHQ